jgi:hypothetical protein
MIPKKACPGLDPGVRRFSEKHALGLDRRDHAQIRNQAAENQNQRFWTVMKIRTSVPGP